MSAIRRTLVESEGGVRRATLEVALGGDDSALVSLVLRDGGVVSVCSCGAGPGCAHTSLALRWVLDGPSDDETQRLVAQPIATDAGGLRAPTPTTDPGRTAAPLQRAQALAAALDDLITSVVRAGVDAAAGTPSLDESLRRLVAAAPAPLPSSIARVVGRLREALVAHDLDLAARLCAGLGLLADALRDGDPRTTVAWLGVSVAGSLEPRPTSLEARPAALEARPTALEARPTATTPGTTAAPRDAPTAEPRLVDTRLVELAREWVSTIDRAGLERRYLIEPVAGAIYREERLRGATAPSLGPCPRILTVALAELDAGPAPRRVRLLQYEVALGPEAAVYTEIATHAAGVFAPLLALFRDAIGAYPALAEPFVLVAPHAIERTRAGADLVDADGGRLALAAEPVAASAALLALATEHVPAIVAGRLVASQGALALAPLSAVIGPPDAHALRRLT